MAKSIASDSVEAQKQYVQQLKKKNFKFGLTVGEAFVRGIRDIGYKNTGTAFDELIDNAMQSGAANVHVVFGYGASNSDKKPSEIAIIDDGHGMVPDMVRAAVTWGGTHRENDRAGFGRYGYGLPSACVSTGKRYTVYSRTQQGDYHAVTIDIDDLSAGEYTTQSGDIIVPEAHKAKLPRFVEEHMKKHFPKGAPKNGTIVLIEKLDKITWKTTGHLQENLLRHFGVVYHGLRADLDIWVNDKRVEPIDPLFVTPDYRWYDLDSDRAVPLEPILIDVKNPETRAVEGQISIRMSYLPASFASIDKTKGAVRGNQNERWSVMKDYDGFIFSRMGRIVDVVNNGMLTTFVNYDRFIKIEIDFPAVLDEEFNVTTSKQQIVPSERMWMILKENGLMKAVDQLRKKANEDRAKHREQSEEDPERRRPAEAAYEATAKMKAMPKPELAAAQEEAGEKNLQQEAERRARETGSKVAEVRKELEFSLQGRLYKVAKESMPGAPFFRITMFGGTRTLFLNTAHRFYKDIHSGPSSNPEVRAGIEILLFSIGDRMLDASESLRETYTHELLEWSKKLEYALGQLATNVAHKGDDDLDSNEDLLRQA